MPAQRSPQYTESNRERLRRVNDTGGAIELERTLSSSRQFTMSAPSAFPLSPVQNTHVGTQQTRGARRERSGRSMQVLRIPHGDAAAMCRGDCSLIRAHTCALQTCKAHRSGLMDEEMASPRVSVTQKFTAFAKSLIAISTAYPWPSRS